MYHKFTVNSFPSVCVQNFPGMSVPSGFPRENTQKDKREEKSHAVFTHLPLSLPVTVLSEASRTSVYCSRVAV